MFQLILKQNGVIVRALPIGKGTYTIGRALTNDLVLEGDGVSRVHAKIHFTEGQLFFRDLDSANGSFTDGRRINSALKLTNGLEVIIDQFSLSFKQLDVVTDESVDIPPPPPQTNQTEDDATRVIEDAALISSKMLDDAETKTKGRVPPELDQEERTGLFSRILGLEPRASESGQQSSPSRASGKRPRFSIDADTSVTETDKVTAENLKAFARQNEDATRSGGEQDDDPTRTGRPELEMVADVSLDEEVEENSPFAAGARDFNATINEEIYDDSIHVTLHDEQKVTTKLASAQSPRQVPGEISSLTPIDEASGPHILSGSSHAVDDRISDVSQTETEAAADSSHYDSFLDIIGLSNPKRRNQTSETKQVNSARSHLIDEELGSGIMNIVGSSRESETPEPDDLDSGDSSIILNPEEISESSEKPPGTEALDDNEASASTGGPNRSDSVASDPPQTEEPLGIRISSQPSIAFGEDSHPPEDADFEVIKFGRGTDSFAVEESAQGSPEQPSSLPKAESQEPASEDSAIEASATQDSSSVEKTVIFEGTPRGRFHVIEGALQKTVYMLENDQYSIGRSDECDIVIPDINCSRHHATIRSEGPRYVITDNDSTNGILVNGELSKSHLLTNHDVVQIGDVYFEFVDGENEPLGKLPAAIAVEPSRTVGIRDSAFIRMGQLGRPKRAAFSLPIKPRVAAALAIIVGLSVYLVFTGGKDNTERASARRSPVIRLAQSYWSTLAKEIQTDFAQNGIDISDVPPATLAEEIVLRLKESTFATQLIPVIEGVAKRNPTLLQELVLRPDQLSPVLESALSADTPGTPKDLPGSPVRKPVTAEMQREISSILARMPLALEKKEYAWAISQGERLLKDLDPDNQDVLPWLELARKGKETVDALAEIQAIEKREQQDQLEQLLKSALELQKDDKPREALAKVKEILAADPDHTEAKRIRDILEKETLAVKEQQKEKKDRETRAATLFAKAREYHEKGETGKALEYINTIIEKYDDTPYWNVAVQSKTNLELALEETYRVPLENAKRLMESGAYDQAWKEVTEVLHKHANHKPAVRLRRELTKQTDPLVRKHYNDARIFEIETNDYPAAIEEYRKVLLYANPDGDYYKKAQQKLLKLQRVVDSEITDDTF